jgi:hypothetical protein
MLLASFAAINLLTTKQAFAQQIPDVEQVPASEMRPGVRYITGSYKISGWEDQLVKGDKNLKHWNWSPIVGYTQSSPSRHTGKGATEAPIMVPQQRSYYIKPTHIPTLVAAAVPLHVPVRATHPAVTSTSANLHFSTNNLSGNLLRKPMPTYSYKQIEGSTVSGAVEHREVFGVITRGN